MAEANEILEGNVILIIEGDERELVADRKKLANQFKYFESLFKSDFEEANAEKIILKGGDALSFDALQLLVESTNGAYGSATESTIGSLLKAADYLQVTHTSWQYLYLYYQARHRSPRTLLENFNIFHRLFKEKIYEDQKKWCGGICYTEPVETMGKNLKTLIFERGWPNLEPGHIINILSYGKNNFEALDILVQGIKIWINHDYEGRKEFLPQFLPLIKGFYNYTDLESVLEMIVHFEPRKMDWNFVAIDILLEKLKLTSLKEKLEIKK